MLKNLSIPIILSLLSLPAFADDRPDPGSVTIGTPSMGGSGCPQGSTATVLSPDSTSLSILFDSYHVEAGKSSGKTIDRKTCDMVIPIKIPQGYGLSLAKLDYRGFNALPLKATSEFSVNYLFSGSRGPVFSRSFHGPSNRDFTFTTPVIGPSLTWSSCGGEVQLKINSSLLVQSNPSGELAMATVDSTDVKAAFVYQLQWKRCNPNGQPGNPRPNPNILLPNDPRYYTGNCSIDADPQGSGYWVRGVRQNLVGRASNYAAAITLARAADTDGRCLSSRLLSLVEGL